MGLAILPHACMPKPLPVEGSALAGTIGAGCDQVPATASFLNPGPSPLEWLPTGYLLPAKSSFSIACCRVCFNFGKQRSPKAASRSCRLLRAAGM